MKNFSFKNFIPHLIAIGVFLAVTLIVCKPALESGVVLKQSDLIGWQGMSKQSFDYKEQHGRFPLWVTSMFSGMPAYQIAIQGDPSPLPYIDRTFQLWLPKPMNWFFLACISFYFLCMCLRVRTLPAILGSIGFAFCSFSPIIITAGHETQMYALAYCPAVIGAALLIFDKKYIAGFALTALLTALQISHMHQQISYYLFLILLIMSVAMIIRFIKAKEIPHLAKSLGLLVGAGLIAVAINAITLFPTYDYAKESKRGGQLVMNTPASGEKVEDGKTKGLSKDYAFMWSYGKSELFGLVFPGVMGYGNHYAERDGEGYMFPRLEPDANSVSFMMERLGAPEDQAVGYASQRLYWGKQPFTNGPVYLGAVMIFLFIFGMFYLDNRHKWWILTATILGLLLALGQNLAGFNYFMFDYLPFYNKFRVPTMALVIPQILVPIIAALAISKLSENQDPLGWRKFKQSAVATGALFVIGLLFYAGSDFTNENRKRSSEFDKLYSAKDDLIQQKMMNLDESYKPSGDNMLYEEMVFNFRGSPEAQKSSRELVQALSKDRASLFLSDMTKAFLFMLVAAVLVALVIKRKINEKVLGIGLIILSLIDLLSFDTKYLNDKSFDSQERYEATEFPISQADQMILSDKDPNYRVFNLSTRSPFEESRTSYYHKSIGGYHAAKLGIYDDLTTHQLGGSPNIGVLNMLNTKYVIQNQDGKLVASQNPEALGNAWFVKAVKFVNGPVEEMKALTGFNPKDTVIVDNKFKSLVTSFVPADSSASIRQTDFSNEAITYQSIATANHLAVFSEIYYKDWKAYIDGKPAEYFKANYVLRAMVIPAGNHRIDFKFEPKIFFVSKQVSTISSWLLVIILLLAGFLEWKKKKHTGPAI